MPLPDQHVYGRAAAHPASPRHPRTAASMPSTAPCLSAPACNVRAHAPWVALGSVSRASLGRTVRTLRPLRHSVGVPTRRADGVVASRRALGKTAKRMAIVSRGGVIPRARGFSKMRFPRPDRIAPFRVVRTGSEMASGRPCRPTVETGSGLFVGAIEAGRQHVSEQQYI